MKQRVGAEVCVQRAISAYHLHAMLAAFLQREVFTFEQLKGWRDQIAELMARSQTDLSAQRAGLAQKRDGLRRKVDNLLNLLEDHPSAALVERLKARRNELAAVVVDLARVGELLSQRGAALTDREQRVVSEHFTELLADADPAVARRALQSVVVEADLFADRLALTIEPPITASWTMPPRELLPVNTFVNNLPADVIPFEPAPRGALSHHSRQ